VLTAEADSRISFGGCVVDTDSGTADGRIESQLQMLKAELTKIES
jgi:flagellar biosynthesis/type III secretory pathway protein FliH